MSPHRVERREVVVCFPRVSGDEPGLKSMVETVASFSPRERG